MGLFKKDEIKRNLHGIFEIALFMPNGFERIETDTSRMLRSFIWPLTILPIVLLTTVMLSDGTYPASFLLIAHGTRIIIAFALSLTMIIVFCKHYDRLEFLYKYITVANWFELALLTLILPIFIMLSSGMATVEQLSSFAIFVSLVSYAYTGYILTHTLRIPWEMGGFLAIAFMMISETGYDIIDLLKSTFYGA